MQTGTRGPTESRIWFAHMLRGLAALTVMVGHYLGFFLSPESIAHLAYTNPIAPEPDLLSSRVLVWLATWYFGPPQAAVALFFLISGFVIPFSFSRATAAQFVVRRVLRIYPLYVVGLSITIATVWIHQWAEGQPMPYTLTRMVANASLLRDWLAVPSIDGVNWTLEVEVKFYLLCAVIAAVSDLKRPAPLLLAGAVAAVFSWSTANLSPTAVHPIVFNTIAVLSYTATLLPFMLVGTCVHNVYEGYWTARRGVTIGVLLFGDFVLGTVTGATRALAEPQLFSYAVALVLFLACCRWRHVMPKARALDLAANVSYPLYVVHGVVGYVLLTVLRPMFPNAYLTFATTVTLVLALSYLLHRLVEAPANRLGRTLAERLPGEPGLPIGAARPELG